jgi:hypothetical protein
MAHPNIHLIPHFDFPMGRRGRDRMVFGFITTNSMNSHFSNLQRISIEIPGFGYDV